MRELSISKEHKYASALRPVAASGSSDIPGVEIDLLSLGRGAGAGAFLLESGAVSGSPSAHSVTFRVQHSDTSGSGFADVDASLHSGTVTLSQNSRGSVYVDTLGTKRFIKVIALPAFTGGSSPTLPVSATFVADDVRVL